MKEVSTSEKSVNIYQITRRNITEVNNFHTCRRVQIMFHVNIQTKNSIF
jgi:hypothetical protein